MEDAQEHRRILLHVEDDRSLCTAETRQSGRGWVEAEASLHSQLHQTQSSSHHQQQQQQEQPPQRHSERQQRHSGTKRKQAVRIVLLDGLNAMVHVGPLASQLPIVSVVLELLEEIRWP